MSPTKIERFQERNQTTRRVYAFIRAFILENGYSPSLREIAVGCYMSRGGVQRYLDLLEAWGCISRTPGMPRSIALLEDDCRL